MNNTWARLITTVFPKMLHLSFNQSSIVCVCVWLRKFRMYFEQDFLWLSSTEILWINNKTWRLVILPTRQPNKWQHVCVYVLCRDTTQQSLENQSQLKRWVVGIAINVSEVCNYHCSTSRWKWQPVQTRQNYIYALRCTDHTLCPFFDMSCREHH